MPCESVIYGVVKYQIDVRFIMSNMLILKTCFQNKWYHTRSLSSRIFPLMILSAITMDCWMTSSMNDTIYLMWASFFSWNVCLQYVSTLRPRQHGRHFAFNTFKRLFLHENTWISIKISLKFVAQGPINNIPALFDIMATGHCLNQRRFAYWRIYVSLGLERLIVQVKHDMHKYYYDNHFINLIRVWKKTDKDTHRHHKTLTIRIEYFFQWNSISWRNNTAPCSILTAIRLSSNRIFSMSGCVYYKKACDWCGIRHYLLPKALWAELLP